MPNKKQRYETAQKKICPIPEHQGYSISRILITKIGKAS